MPLRDIHPRFKTIKRTIVKREPYRANTARDGTRDSILATLSCGHTKKYKAVQEPKGSEAYCNDCKV